MSVSGVSGLPAIYESLLQTNAAQTALGGPAQTDSLTGQGPTVVPGEGGAGALPPGGGTAHPAAGTKDPWRLNTVA
jgi:hypothetical protein